jgi:hypothetical protein
MLLTIRDFFKNKVVHVYLCASLMMITLTGCALFDAFKRIGMMFVWIITILGVGFLAFVVIKAVYKAKSNLALQKIKDDGKEAQASMKSASTLKKYADQSGLNSESAADIASTVNSTYEIGGAKLLGGFGRKKKKKDEE